MAATPSAADLRARFDAAPAFTVGLEEEVFCCHPETLAPVPAAPLLERLHGDPRFKPELPLAQLELVTPPRPTTDEALEDLRSARRDLVRAAGRDFAFVACGLHPTAPLHAQLGRGGRYDVIVDEYGDVARRQLLGALQVHVAVPGAELALATYNGLRAHLPALMALAAHAPFHLGRDTGLATMRPPVSTQLPRQGLPPALASWEELAQAYATLGDPALWWWELRPHPLHGTLEVRVCDAQATWEDAARVVRAVVSVVRRVARAGGAAVPPEWQLAAERWSAVRHGVEGAAGGVPTRERLAALGIDVPEETAVARLRAVGVERAPRWLADRFAAGL